MNAPFKANTTAGRWDLYGPVHKGMRRGHLIMVQRLGAANFAADQTALLADLRRHLRIAALHLKDEAQFIHPALEERQPGAAGAIEEQHLDHHDHHCAIEDLMVALERGPEAMSVQLGRELYLAFTRYVGEDMAHMAHEEEVVWPQLCALFTDAELIEMELKIIGSLAPEDTMSFMQLMIPAMNRSERVMLLSGMKQGAPPEVYAAVIDNAARPALDPEEMTHLELTGLA